MASISSIPRAHFHVRSISLPSRSSQIYELDDLEDLYSSFDNLLKKVQSNGVNELLDELLRLLEMCSTATDVLLSTRDSAQQLQSSLRRKRGDSIEISCAIKEYQSKRKTIKKTIVKAMRHLKSSCNKKIKETPLRENMESVTLKVLESLCFVLGSSSERSSNKWSLVSKVLGPKQSSEQSLVGNLDVELANKFTSLNVENVQKDLAQMEFSLEDIQEGLGCIYRHLIKTRVTLLNLLNC